MSTWCSYCVHDHGMHWDDDDTDRACSIILESMTKGYPEPWWPVEWVPEPDDGDYYLPSRMICTKFEACTALPCDGDPGERERAERVEGVTVYWRNR